MELGHSNKVLNIFISILDGDGDDDHDHDNDDKKDINNADNNATTPEDSIDQFKQRLSARLDTFVATLPETSVQKVFSYLSDWNTNSKFCFVCQALLSSFIRVFKSENLMNIKSVAEVVPGLVAYSERHYTRLDGLHQAM